MLPQVHAWIDLEDGEEREQVGKDKREERGGAGALSKHSQCKRSVRSDPECEVSLLAFSPDCMHVLCHIS